MRAGNPTGVLHELFKYLATLELAFLGLSMAFGKNQSLFAIIEKIFTLCFIWWIMQNFYGLTTYVKEYVIGAVAEFFGHDPNNYTNFVFTPDDVMSMAMKQVIEPVALLIQAVQEGSVALDWTRVFNPAVIMELIFYTLTSMAVGFSFLVIALQLFLGYVEFYIILVLAYVLFPFVIFEPTRFLGERALPAVFGQIVKIGVLIVTTFLVVSAMQATLPTRFLNALTYEQQHPSIPADPGVFGTGVGAQPARPDFAAVVKRYYPTVTALNQVSISTILSQIALLSIAGAATAIFAPGVAIAFLGGMPSFNLLSAVSTAVSLAALGRSRSSPGTSSSSRGGGSSSTGGGGPPASGVKAELGRDMTRASQGGGGGAKALPEPVHPLSQEGYQRWADKNPQIAQRTSYDDYRTLFDQEKKIQ